MKTAPIVCGRAVLLLVTALFVIFGVVFGLAKLVRTDLGHQSRLVNVSCRGPIGTGPECALVGFVITESSQTVVVRARGWATAKPAEQRDVLLRVVNNATGVDVGRNQQWRAAGNERLGQDLKQFAPADPRHAAVVLTLPPGGYSALVEERGAAGGGTAAIELFVVPN